MSLTDEDKNWILAQLASLPDKEWTIAQLAINAATANATTDQLRHEVNANIERVETSLLTEFHKWASPLEARMRTHSAALRAIDLEFEALSERVTKLEPPH